MPRGQRSSRLSAKRQNSGEETVAVASSGGKHDTAETAAGGVDAPTDRPYTKKSRFQFFKKKADEKESMEPATAKKGKKKKTDSLPGMFLKPRLPRSEEAMETGDVAEGVGERELKKDVTMSEEEEEEESGYISSQSVFLTPSKPPQTPHSSEEEEEEGDDITEVSSLTREMREIVKLKRTIKQGEEAAAAVAALEKERFDSSFTLESTEPLTIDIPQGEDRTGPLPPGAERSEEEDFPSLEGLTFPPPTYAKMMAPPTFTTPRVEDEALKKKKSVGLPPLPPGMTFTDTLTRDLPPPEFRTPADEPPKNSRDYGRLAGTPPPSANQKQTLNFLQRQHETPAQRTLARIDQTHPQPLFASTPLNNTFKSMLLKSPSEGERLHPMTLHDPIPIYPQDGGMVLRGAAGVWEEEGEEVARGSDFFLKYFQERAYLNNQPQAPNLGAADSQRALTAPTPSEMEGAVGGVRREKIPPTPPTTPEKKKSEPSTVPVTDSTPNSFYTCAKKRLDYSEKDIEEVSRDAEEIFKDCVDPFEEEEEKETHPSGAPPGRDIPVRVGPTIPQPAPVPAHAGPSIPAGSQNFSLGDEVKDDGIEITVDVAGGIPIEMVLRQKPVPRNRAFPGLAKTWASKTPKSKTGKKGEETGPIKEIRLSAAEVRTLCNEVGAVVTTFNNIMNATTAGPNQPQEIPSPYSKYIGRGLRVAATPPYWKVEFTRWAGSGRVNINLKIRSLRLLRNMIVEGLAARLPNLEIDITAIPEL